MIEKNTLSLFQRYIDGWKQNNLSVILSCLTYDCVIIESHGPTYHGISDIEQWVTFWLEAKSKITKWDILSFYFCEDKKTAFFEWDFACISNDIEYALPGTSIVQFTEEKISFIHEYRMTHKPYKWEATKLISE